VTLLLALALAVDPVDAEGEGDIVVIDDADAETTDPQETSASVTVIEVDDSLPAASDVSTVVDSASGTTVQRLGGLGDFSGVSIRGSTMRQVQVSLDGVPLNPDGSGAVNLSSLPLWAFERVEIYRGNAPPELAAAPIGGVVNLRTGSPNGLGVSLTAGSLRTGHGTVVAAGDRGPFEGLFIVDGFRTDGDFVYFNDNGTEYNLDDDSFETRLNNEKAQVNAHMRLRVGDDRLRLTLMEALLVRDEGLPGHAGSPTSSVHLSTRRSLTSAVVDRSPGLWSTRLMGWALVLDETFDDRQGEIGLGSQHTSSRFNALGLTGTTRGALGSFAVPALTVAVRTDRYASTDLVSHTSTTASRWALTPSASADVWLFSDSLTLTGVMSGLVLDSVAGQDADRLRFAAPRGGVLYRPIPNLAFKANAGRYLRPPDFTELFGDRGAMLGNPNLREERGVQADVGVRGVSPSSWRVQGTAEVAGFWNAVDGMIVYVQNSQRTAVPLNLEDAWIRGVEAALTLQLGPVDSQSNLTRTWSENRSQNPQYAGNQLPRVPNWEAYQRTAVSFRGLRVGHSFSYTDGNMWDRTNWYRASPRPVHGAFVQVTPKAPWPSIELDVLNATNRIVETVPRNPLDPSDEATVQQPLTDFVGYPLPGRTLLLTLRWETP
jgi:vitamin B12 transporter